MRQGLGHVRQNIRHGPESALRQPRLPGPAPLPPTLQLQRTLGNQGMQRLLATHALQAKLPVSQPNDPFEQEADRVASQVMRMPAPENESPCPACASGLSTVPDLRRPQGAHTGGAHRRLGQQRSSTARPRPRATARSGHARLLRAALRP